MLLVYINITTVVCDGPRFSSCVVIVMQQQRFLVFFFLLRVDMGPVVRDTTDQMRIAFSHQLRVLLYYSATGTSHSTKSNPFVLLCCWRVAVALLEILSQQQLKRKLQKKLHHSLKYFIFIFVNRTNTRKWARHLLLLGEFIYSQSQTRNEMTSF